MLTFCLIKIIAILTFGHLLVLQSASSASPGKCDVALSRCTSDMTCGMILHDYRISCKNELYGLTSNCSEVCQLSIVALLTTTPGNDYLHCDCDNEYCRRIRQRMENCYERVNLPTLNNTKSCRVSEMYCKTSPFCDEAIQYYNKLCQSAFEGKVCSDRCNNSIAILKRQRWGVDVDQCNCEGDFSDICEVKQNRIKRLCFGVGSSGQLLSMPILVVFLLIVTQWIDK